MIVPLATGMFVGLLAATSTAGTSPPAYQGSFECQCSPGEYFSQIAGVAASSSGKLFTVMSLGGVLRHTASGAFESFWSVPAPGAPAHALGHIAVDRDDNILVVDQTDVRVLRQTQSGQTLGTIGSAVQGPGSLNTPSGVASSEDGSIYVTDIVLHQITKYDHLGGYLTHWSASGDYRPFVDDSGYVYAMERGFKRVYKYSPSGQQLLYWGGWGSGPGQFGSNFQPGGPTGGAQGPDGLLYIADNNNHRVQVFNTMGEFQFEFGSEGDGPYRFGSLGAPAFDALGNLYIPDAVNQKVHKYGPGPVPTKRSSWGAVKSRYR